VVVRRLIVGGMRLFGHVRQIFATIHAVKFARKQGLITTRTEVNLRHVPFYSALLRLALRAAAFAAFNSASCRLSTSASCRVSWPGVDTRARVPSDDDMNQSNGTAAPRGNATPALGSLSQFGLVRFAGPDTLSFLQGQLSNDTDRLAAGAPLLAAYSTPQGRVVAVLHLLPHSSGVMAILPREIVLPTVRAAAKVRAACQGTNRGCQRPIRGVRPKRYRRFSGRRAARSRCGARLLWSETASESRSSVRTGSRR